VPAAESGGARSPRPSPDAAAVLAACLLGTIAVVWGVAAWRTPAVAGASAALALQDPLLLWWWMQAMCLGALLPGCVTLWREAGALRAALCFVLLPAPLWALAWLTGALDVGGLMRAVGLLLLLAGVAVAAWSAAQRLLPWRSLRPAVGVALQVVAAAIVARGILDDRVRVWIGL
jgi:hypothetical protein